ncbi:MAG: hypothetical protein KDE28_29070, partial [Anaerolineales bacterium]|nr:hypothetical protein [Anaerolineales bacterium]
TVGKLRDLLVAEAGSAASLLQLRVQYKDPDVAALVANNWASFFVEWVNEIYGYEGDSQLRFFEEQLDQAENELNVAEQSLIMHQADNLTDIVTIELMALQNQQTTYLQRKQDISQLTQDIQGMLLLLEGIGTGNDVVAPSQLTLLMLELRAFNLISPEASVPIQFQVDSAESFGQQNREDQASYLRELLGVLLLQTAEIDAVLVDLEPQILDLQQQRQEVELQTSTALRNFTIAEETYIALARKVEEENITSQDLTDGVRFAGIATPPSKPIAPNTLLNTMVAVVAGLMIGLLALVIRAWQMENRLREHP